jgi:hypothetical protein
MAGRTFEAARPQVVPQGGWLATREELLAYAKRDRLLIVKQPVSFSPASSQDPSTK